MRKLVIFGAGDIAQIANYYFKLHTDYSVEAFTVDGAYMKESAFEGKPVVAFEDLKSSFLPGEFDLFIALSYKNMNKIRQAKYEQAKKEGYQLASYISPKCSYLSPFQPGDNCFIFEDNTIQPYVQIGNNVTLWSGNHIGHHSTIEDHNFISSHVVISGHCHIEKNCFIGVNATIHNNIRIASETLVGAGATITKNTEAQSVYLPPKSNLFSKKSNELNF
jgi:sugar O-acyltransferase (sialic acid O-acetyltransferase NeuD family)